MPGRAAEADTLQPDLSPVSEALNVAWAQHELTAEHLDQVGATRPSAAPCMIYDC